MSIRPPASPGSTGVDGVAFRPVDQDAGEVAPYAGRGLWVDAATDVYNPGVFFGPITHLGQTFYFGMTQRGGGVELTAYSTDPETHEDLGQLFIGFLGIDLYSPNEQSYIGIYDETSGGMVIDAPSMSGTGVTYLLSRANHTGDITLTDRTTSTVYRLFVDGGVLDIEAV